VKEMPLETRLLVGAALFGTGWALSGLCPGTLLAGGFFAYSHALLLLIGIGLGNTLIKFVDKCMHKDLAVHESEPLLAQRAEDDQERLLARGPTVTATYADTPGGASPEGVPYPEVTNLQTRTGITTIALAT
jgi:hypothetical protein